MTLRLAAYVLSAAILFSAGWMAEDWRATAQIEAIKLSDANEKTNAEMAVRVELERQLLEVKNVASNNSQIIEKLTNENAAITADRDANMVLARRLLANAAQSTAASHRVPTPGSGPQFARPSSEASTESVARLLVAAADECDRNADRLDALIAEVSAQL